MATGQDVIDRVRQVVNDVASQFITAVRWSDDELIAWITDGQREIVKVKPEAYPVTEVFQVTANSPRQRLDATEAYRLIRVEANAVGSVGNAISLLAAEYGSDTNGGTGAVTVDYTPVESDALSQLLVVVAFLEAASDMTTFCSTLSVDGHAMTVRANLPADNDSTIARVIVATLDITAVEFSSPTVSVQTIDPEAPAGGLFSLYTVINADPDTPLASAVSAGQAEQVAGVLSVALDDDVFAAGQLVLAGYAQGSALGDAQAYTFDPDTELSDGYLAAAKLSETLVVGFEGFPGTEMEMTPLSFVGTPTDTQIPWGIDDPDIGFAFAAILQPQLAGYGDALRIVERDVFDSFSPAWMRASGQPSVDNYYRAYCMDANDPLAFWLSPRPVTGRNVWVTYAGIPAVLEDAEDTLSLSDMYVAPIVDYTVYRALNKEAREANREVADRYLRAFYAALGVHRPVLMSIGQNASRPPEAQA